MYSLTNVRIVCVPTCVCSSVRHPCVQEQSAVITRPLLPLYGIQKLTGNAQRHIRDRYGVPLLLRNKEFYFTGRHRLPINRNSKSLIVGPLKYGLSHGIYCVCEVCLAIVVSK